jgi:hypothetical protein
LRASKDEYSVAEAQNRVLAVRGALHRAAIDPCATIVTAVSARQRVL